jgi:hypothetical protein
MDEARRQSKAAFMNHPPVGGATMQQIPRLYIQKGHIVWPAGARRWKRRVTGQGPVVARARQLATKHEDVYIVDVDGLQHTHANLELYQAMEKAGVHPWLEAGFRRIEDVMDGFFAGAERVTVRLAHMPPETFRELTSMAEGEVHLGVDAGQKDGIKGWRTADVAAYVGSAEADGVVVTADGSIDEYHLGTIASELRRSGVAVTVAPWAGTRPRVPNESADRILFDPPEESS